MTLGRFVERVVVHALSTSATRGQVTLGGLRYRCALGRSGTRHLKREGDGASPAGAFAMRFVYYRGDRIKRPRTGLPLRPLRRDDGWCDDPGSVRYNRPVRHPFSGSAEELWRNDGLYDVVVVLGHNDRPVVRGRGSAIFLHVAGPGFCSTAGCIAMAGDDLLRLLAHVDCRSRLIIP